MYQKTWFWLLFVLIGALSLVFIYFYANQALSVVSVESTMNRKSSLLAADSLHNALGIGLKNYKAATAFGSDDEFQNYVELKAGGKEAFQKVIHGNGYKPYYWQVRHFKASETREFTAYFTPLGVPWGFEEVVPEDELRPSLARDDAKAFAESLATGFWNIDLQNWVLIESALTERPNGRKDHNFVYERCDIEMAEAKFRMQLSVSGDKLSALQRSVKIPQSFTKEFENMRSFNSLLATVASAMMLIIYGILLLYWFVLYSRRKLILWKPSLLWAGIIGIMLFLAQLNYFSFSWFAYDTSTGVSTFIFGQIIAMLVQSVGMAALALITFTVAEAVSREAFPWQIKLWNVFNKDMVCTKAVLGRVLGGYLMVPLFLAYVVGFYVFSNRVLGWWYPSSSLSDPNILGSFFPWITAIGQALQAGFWEEAMFRALPLASMAIIGTKLEKRKLFIGLGILLQAFIFSGAHAGYPQQPFYFRLVELLIPSLAFAFLYLRFGLLSAVIMHFAYDAVLMNLSSFLTKAPGLALDRSIFVIVFFLPIIYILYQKLRKSLRNPGSGKNLLYRVLFENWEDLPEPNTEGQSDTPQELTNPLADAQPSKDPSEPKLKSGSASKQALFIFLLVSILSVGILPRILPNGIFGSKAQEAFAPAPKLKISASQANRIAKEYASKLHGTDLPDTYKAFTNILISPTDERYAVAINNAPTVYKNLLNNYLYQDAWDISFKRFDGDLQERLLSYNVLLQSDGTLISMAVDKAEDYPGEDQSEYSARGIAQEFLKSLNPENYENMKEISAIPLKLPKRTDWVFTWQDTGLQDLQAVQGRISITVNGNGISRVKRHIFITEELQRSIYDKSQKAMISRISSKLLFAIFFVLLFVIGLFKWSRKEVDIPTLILVLAILIPLGAISSILNWQQQSLYFSTTEPYSNQMISTILALMMKYIFISGAAAITLAWTVYWLKNRDIPNPHGSHTKLHLFASLAIAFAIAINSRYLGVLILPDLAPGANLFPFAYILERGFLMLFQKLGLIFGFWYVSAYLCHTRKDRPVINAILALVAAFILVAPDYLPFADSIFVLPMLLKLTSVFILLWISTLIQRYYGFWHLMWYSLLFLGFVYAGNAIVPVFPSAALQYILSALLGVTVIGLFYRKSR